MRPYRGDRRRGNIVAGSILLTLGTLFLVDRLGYFRVHDIWTYWPVVFFVIGLSQILGPGGPWRVGRGFANFLLGLAFFAILQHWWGLTWRTGWPLLLIGTGVGMVARSFMPRPSWRWEDYYDRTGSGASRVDEEGRHE